MDTVPDVIIINIFTYLNKNNLGRFQQLNSRFRELIKKNRRYLDYPALFLEIWDRRVSAEKSYLNNITIVFNDEECLLDFSDFEEICVAKWGHPHYESFFESFFATPNTNRSLGSLFSFIFERCDLFLTVRTQVSKVIETLTESINRCESLKVFRVEIDFHPQIVLEFLDLLTSIGAETVKPEYWCLLTIQVKEVSLWSHLSRTITIFESFYDVTIQIKELLINSTMMHVAQEWQKSAIQVFPFKIHCKDYTKIAGYHLGTTWSHGVQALPFEYNNLNVVGDEDFIRFEDKATKKVLQFCRKNNKESKLDEDSDDVLHAYDVTIETN